MSSEATEVAWIALGANLGHRGRALASLRGALEAAPGITLEAASRELLTRPVGITRQPDFHNQVVRLRSEPPRPPGEWLALCHRAEGLAGRRPTHRWGPRRADADILLLGERGEHRAGPDPRVPHPALGERPFFCALLAELDPGLRHPDGWSFADRAGRFRRPDQLRGGGSAGV